MKTASWRTYTGPGRVGICLGAPRRAPAGFRLYRALAPTRPMLTQPLAVYRPAYEAILARLDPHQVWTDLHELAAGAEPHMMCFEVGPWTEENFCHRHMAARWLEGALNVEIPEYDPTAAQPSLFAEPVGA